MRRRRLLFGAAIVFVAIYVAEWAARGLSGGSPGGPASSSYATATDGTAAWAELLARNGHDVARVHTGDPVLFGSTAEQMRRMAELGIAYEIIPGVSSFTAAAALEGPLGWSVVAVPN